MKIQKVEENQKEVEKTITNPVEKTIEREKTKVVVNEDNFWQIKDLPSKGLCYPEGTIITARPLKLLEVKALSTLSETNVNFITTDILRKCVKGIDIDSILASDKIFIIFWLRANTYQDSGYKVNFECKKCEMDSTYHFEIDNMQVESIRDDYNPEKVLTLPISEDKITFSYSTIRDETNVENFVEKNKNNKLITLDNDFLQASSEINMINGEELSLKGKYEYLINIDPRDYSFLETYLKEINIGIQPLLEVVCDKCGGISPSGLTFRSDFFIPNYTA